MPNLSFGPNFVRMVKDLGGMTVDARLLVENPETVAPWFVDAGADIVTVHLEACKDASKTLADIRKHGAKAGLAVKPKTAAEPLIELLGGIDLALIMTVEPGFGGAKFLDGMLPKVRAVRQAIDARGLDCWLQVDGGIHMETVSAAAQAGADSLVAGSAIFGAKDMVAGGARSERARQTFIQEITGGTTWQSSSGCKGRGSPISPITAWSPSSPRLSISRWRRFASARTRA